jgi:hypothetical protein
MSKGVAMIQEQVYTKLTQTKWRKKEEEKGVTTKGESILVK